MKSFSRTKGVEGVPLDFQWPDWETVPLIPAQTESSTRCQSCSSGKKVNVKSENYSFWWPWRGSYSSDSLISLLFNPWTGHTSALKNPAYRGFIVNHRKPTSACWFSPGLSLEMVEAFPSAVCAWVCLPEDAEDHDSRDQRHEGDAVANGVADLHLPKKFALMKQQRHDHMLMYTCAVWLLHS